MGGNEVSLGLVFLAGMLSFLSPCVLPIVPAYLTTISGMSFEELQEEDAVRRARWRLFSSALGFIAGFALVTVLILGGSANLVGLLGSGWKSVIRVGGGIVVIIFALHMIGVFRINLLFREQRFHLEAKKFGPWGAVLIGAAFAFGWSPCIGPILVSVFSLAANTTHAGAAWWYLVVYTIGLAVPFMLTALFVNLFLSTMRKMTRHLRAVEIMTGVLLLAMGVILLTNRLTFISEHGGVLTALSQRMEGWLQ